MSRSKINILKDAFSYSGATFIVQNITFFLAIFVRRQLGPEAIGIWTVSQLFLGYASYAGMGMYDAICREIPILRGRQDEKGVSHLKQVALTFTFLSSAV